MKGLREELEVGGEWLRACREWIKWNVHNGDMVTWGSNTEVVVTIRQLEDMALNVAISAIHNERSKESI